jgi:hypothetical protein
VGQYLFTGSETTSAYLTVQSVSDDGQSVDCLVANTCVLEGVQLTVHFGNMSNQAPILSDRVGAGEVGAAGRPAPSTAGQRLGLGARGFVLFSGRPGIPLKTPHTFSGPRPGPATRARTRLPPSFPLARPAPRTRRR